MVVVLTVSAVAITVVAKDKLADAVRGAGEAVAAGVVTGAGGSATASAPGSGVAAAAATSTGAVAFSLTTGPVALLVLGASEEPTTSAYTFDCRKQVVHDTSPEPSSGRLLREIVMDPRVKQVTTSDNSTYPEIILENIWNEKYRIEYVQLLPSDQWAAHAVLMSA